MHVENPHLPVTNKAVLTIAVPMALGYLTTPLVGIADTAIIGQLGNAALIGGVAVAAIFVGILLTTMNFLRFATSALTAQSYGRSDHQEVVAVLLRSCLIAVVAGVIVVALHKPILTYGLWLMNPSDAVGAAAVDYFKIRILATPFTLLNYVFLAWFVGTNRPVLSFMLQSFLNLSNVAISYYFVLHLELGAEGAALGTLVAEAATVVISVGFLASSVLHYRSQLFSMVCDLVKLKAMMLLNSDIMVRSFCLHAAFGFFTRQSAQQTDTILAANEILLHFFMISGHFLDGFAVAAEQFVGRSVGTGNRQNFRRAVWLTSLWNLLQATLLSLIFFAFGLWIIDFMTPSEEVRETARLYVLWASATPLIGVAAFQMDGIFIGATWSKDMRNSMIVSLLIFVVAYYVLFPLMGNHGLWLALWIFLSLRSVTLIAVFRRREQQVFT